MTQPTQREALPIWEQIIEAMKQGISECRKEFNGTEDDDDLIAFMYPKIHNVLLEALQSPEMVEVVADKIAESGNAFCSGIQGEEYTLAKAALQAIGGRVR